MVGSKPPPGFSANADKCAFSASCPPPADVSKLMSFEYVHLFVEVLRLLKILSIFYVFLQLLPVVNRLYKISSNPAVLVVALGSKQGIINLL